MREHWDRLADVWEQRVVAQNEQIDPYGIVGIDALPLDDDTSILDVGCGPGITTIELARRAGPNAVVTGVDLSPAMIHHARQRRHDAIMRGDITPGNVELRIADVQTDDLGTGHDTVFSKFGVMFFSEPTKAFANLASALKPDGCLSIVTWAAPEHNPWMPLATVAAATALGATLDPPPAEGPGPFSLSDRDASVALLTSSGLDRIDVIEVTQPRRIRHHTERHWADLSIRTGPLAAAFDGADHETREAAIDAAVGALAPYHQGGPAGDWLIPAHARVYVARKA